MTGPAPGRVAELRRLAADAEDWSGCFTAMYAEVTARVERRCAEGRFDDPERMLAFVDVFAGYYTRAAADRAGGPGCWRAAWDVAADPGPLVTQHLLLGINAHVNHDLPQAVVDVVDRTGDLASARRDFDAVNDVLAEAYDDVLARLGRVSRWTAVAASAGGGRLFRFSLTTARRQAWGAAERLRPLDAAARRGYVAELDRLVGVLAYLIVSPAPPVSWLVPLCRRLEERDPRRVARALLGPEPS
jgi:hypothetical protein